MHYDEQQRSRVAPHTHHTHTLKLTLPHTYSFLPFLPLRTSDLPILSLLHKEGRAWAWAPVVAEQMKLHVHWAFIISNLLAFVGCFFITKELV